jgi:hypothetical protein
VGMGMIVIMIVSFRMNFSSGMMAVASVLMTLLVVRCGNTEAHEANSDQNDLSTHKTLR